MIYFPTNWGAKEPRNLPNHRVVKVTTMIFTLFWGHSWMPSLISTSFSIGILSGGSIPPKEKHTVWPKLSKKKVNPYMFFWGHQADEGRFEKNNSDWRSHGGMSFTSLCCRRCGEPQKDRIFLGEFPEIGAWSPPKKSRLKYIWVSRS